jgi:hypothetical protein
MTRRLPAFPWRADKQQQPLIWSELPSEQTGNFGAAAFQNGKGDANFFILIRNAFRWAAVITVDSVYVERRKETNNKKPSNKGPSENGRKGMLYVFPLRNYAEGAQIYIVEYGIRNWIHVNQINKIPFNSYHLVVDVFPIFTYLPGESITNNSHACRPLFCHIYSIPFRLYVSHFESEFWRISSLFLFRPILFAWAVVCERLRVELSTRSSFFNLTIL